MAVLPGSRRRLADGRLDGRPGRLTSTTAWRYWDWDPSNDRDFIGLPVTTISAAPSTQRQWTQEIRYAGRLRRRAELRRRRLRVPASARLGPVASSRNRARRRRAFSWRRARWRRRPACSTDTASTSTSSSTNVSAALFGQLEWSVTDRLRLLPGLRFNYDQKEVDFDQQVYGGLQTTDPALIALQRSIFAPQAYTADVDDTNVSGQMTVAYKIATSVNAYATYATGFKSVGLNLTACPPTRWTGRSSRGDRQARRRAPRRGRGQDRTASRRHRQPHRLRHRDQRLPGAGRQRAGGRAARLSRQRREGARARRRVRRQRQGEQTTCRSTGPPPTPTASTSRFPDAPPPLEDTGGPQVKDISGSVLPGISKWALSVGGEYVASGDVRPERRVLRRARRQLSLIVLVERQRLAVSGGGRLLPAQRARRASGGRRAGRSRSGRATCWTRTTSSCSRRRLATPACTSGQPGDGRTVGVTMRFAFSAK